MSCFSNRIIRSWNFNQIIFIQFVWSSTILCFILFLFLLLNAKMCAISRECILLLLMFVVLCIYILTWYGWYFYFISLLFNRSFFVHTKHYIEIVLHYFFLLFLFCFQMHIVKPLTDWNVMITTLPKSNSFTIVVHLYACAPIQWIRKDDIERKSVFFSH